MRPLYEIDNEILDCVDLETGEIIDEERLAALEMERDAKIEGIIIWRKDLMAEADAVKAEGKKLYERARVCENKAEQLKKYIEHALEGNKFKTEKCSVSYRNTKSIVIDNPLLLDNKFFKPLDEKWFSKEAIKTAIENGEEVKGAHQEEKQSIIIN